MRTSFLKQFSLAAFALAMASITAFSATTSFKNLSNESIEGAGRNIMRTADGGLEQFSTVMNRVGFPSELICD